MNLYFELKTEGVYLAFNLLLLLATLYYMKFERQKSGLSEIGPKKCISKKFTTSIYNNMFLIIIIAKTSV